MNLLVYPSIYATESGALLMAVSHGKAVIARDIPPFREKAHVGALTTFSDVDDLAEKIRWLLKDGEARRRLEEGARKYAEQNSWLAVAKKHLSLYRKVLGGEKFDG